MGEKTLFNIKHSQDGKLTLVLVRVDDLNVGGDDEFEKRTLKEWLIAQLEMKYLEKLK